MHILFLCNEYPPSVHGGVGTFTQTLGRQLVANGHRVTAVGVYTSGPYGRQDDHGVTVIRIESKGLYGLRSFTDARRMWSEVRRLVAGEGVQVIDGPELAFSLAPKDLGVPCSIRMNGGHHFFFDADNAAVRPVRRWHELRSFRRADYYSAVSDYVADKTEQLLDLHPDHVEILPNPIDTDWFRPHPEVAVEPGRILFVGSVCEKKGIRQLVAALPEIRAAVPSAHLVVAGRDTVDPTNGESYTDGLRAALDDTVNAHVQFLGAVDHDSLPELMAGAAVCACPSHMEAQGIVWGEVMATGRPLVASSLGPGPAVVEDGVSGLLCDPHDPSAVARSVVEVLADEQLGARLSAAARIDAVEKFSVERLAVVNERWFDTIIGRYADGS
jgi:glycosyltransferase involved in cell wall biosynthesis